MRATLVSWTNNPIGTVMAIWDASKTERPLEDIVAENDRATPDRAQLELFQRIIDQQIPVAQFVTFNFVLEDVPISWREQAVRHRIGVKYGDNYAVDIIPEADISFWSQSMRIQSMADFADEEKYHTPESIDGNVLALNIYDETMEGIQNAYSKLVSLGIPMEDARNLIPLGATHRIAMSVNLQALKHIVGERGCWILQGSLWAPVITSMVDELVAKVHPIFRGLVAPPCVSNGKFEACKFVEENIRRVDGRDALPVCPLYYTNSKEPTKVDVHHIRKVEARIPEYAELWGQPDLATTWNWSDR